MKEDNQERTIFQDFFYQAATLEQNQFNLNDEEILTFLRQFEDLYNECVNECLPIAKNKAIDELSREYSSAAGAYGTSAVIGILAGSAFSSLITGFSVFGISAACLVHNLNKKEKAVREAYKHNVPNPESFEKTSNYHLDKMLNKYNIKPCYDRVMEQFKDYKINLDEKTKVYQKSL